jgi:hypothetical protein
LQTLDTRLQFKEVNSVGTYQDRFFFTDHTTGAMTFRVPSGAGHTKDSKFPRVELRENRNWTMDSRDGRQHSESIVLQVLAEPKDGRVNLRSDPRRKDWRLRGPKDALEPRRDTDGS